MIARTVTTGTVQKPDGADTFSGPAATTTEGWNNHEELA